MEEKPKTGWTVSMKLAVALAIVAILYVPAAGPAAFIENLYDFPPDSTYTSIPKVVFWPVWRYTAQNKGSYLEGYIVWWCLWGVHVREGR